MARKTTKSTSTVDYQDTSRISVGNQRRRETRSQSLDDMLTLPKLNLLTTRDRTGITDHENVL
jgi:hypothetical protein